MEKTIILGIGTRSKEKFTHLIPDVEAPSGCFIHRIIVGTPLETSNFTNSLMSSVGIVGEKGTLELLVREYWKEGEILRDVPLEFRNRGIGTDMLEKAEILAKNLGLKKITASTRNPHAAQTYKNIGWNCIQVPDSLLFVAYKEL